MGIDEKLELVGTIIKNWDKVEELSIEMWKKVKALFDKGDKSIGFIKRIDVFKNYYSLSQKTFIKRYSRYILPTEYRSYLLESMVISNLYKKGESKLADKKRLELSKASTRSLRIYNLYNTGILNILFEKIDSLIRDGRNEEEIIGISSKLLDDLINDKSIIYVNLYHNEEELYSKVKNRLLKERYCLIYGSGENVRKIKAIFNKVIEDTDLNNFEVKHNKKNIGNIDHFNLCIFERLSVDI